MNMAKKFLFGSDARKEVLKGMELMYNAVSCTLGPYGRNVLIDQTMNVPAKLTKDGVTVVQDVHSPNQWEEVGIKMIREASQKTAEEAGDATTTAIILAYEMSNNIDLITPKTNVIALRRGMERAGKACSDFLEKFSIKATKDDYVKIARIASQDTEIAEQCAAIFKDIGTNGVITIEYGEKPGIEVEHTDGLSFGEGWLAREMVNAPGATCRMKDVPILITTREIRGPNDFMPLCQRLADAGETCLMVIAEDVAPQALGIMAVNIMKGVFRFCAVKAPSFGLNKKEILKDIAACTGATVVSDETGIRLDKVLPTHLGKAESITVTKERTVVTNKGKQDAVFKRIEQINSLLESKDVIPQSQEWNDLKERLGALTDGVTVVRVGAKTETERHERKDRVDDAIRALQSSVEEGMTPGGGTALLRCLEHLPVSDDRDEQAGIDIVGRALRAPALRILEVAGIQNRELIVSTVSQKKGNVGYNLLTGKYEDLVEADVLDAKKAVRCALENAVSAAKSFLTTECVIGLHQEESEIFKKLLAHVKD